MFGRRNKRLVEEGVRLAIARHIPTSIEIWEESEYLVKSGIEERAVNLGASEQLVKVCHDYVSNMARLYLIDLMESFRKSTIVITNGVAESQKIIMAFGARWSSIDKDVELFFIGNGFSKKFRMIDLLDSLVQFIGSDSLELVGNIWINGDKNSDKYHYFVDEIPKFIEQYQVKCFDLTEAPSNLH